jgi:hypothetical protein
MAAIHRAGTRPRSRATSWCSSSACGSTGRGSCTTGGRCSSACGACWPSWPPIPSGGLLGAHTGLLNGGPAVVQCWRSFEHLERFARDPANLHLPAWRWFNRAVKASGDVGIWHETYLVPAGRYEAIYGSMHRIGQAAAGGHVPIARRGESAAERVGTMANDEVEAST